jgi:acyl-CoA thioester hydrolase
MDSSNFASKSVATTVCRPVEFADTDASGVVHFTRYGVYLESVCLRLLKEIGVLRQVADFAMVPCVRRSEFEYRAPARFGDDLICMAQLD